MKVSNCHDPKMEAYYKEVRRLEDKFHGLELVHITRRYNEAADELSKIASTRSTVPPDAFSRNLHEPSVDLGLGADVESTATHRPDRLFDWRCRGNGGRTMTRSTVRLAHAVPRLPDSLLATKRSIRGPPYRSTGNEIYRRSSTGILQRCITIEEGRKLLEDLHSGLVTTTLLHGPS